MTNRRQDLTQSAPPSEPVLVERGMTVTAPPPARPALTTTTSGGSESAGHTPAPASSRNRGA